MTYDELQALARQQTWRWGEAHHWALDEGQRAWRAAFWGTPPLASTVWNVGRQRGKTFAAVYLALEVCTTKPGAIVRYCAKTKDSAVGIVTPAWEMLVATMPEEMRPAKGRNEWEWAFPNGSRFILFGTDAQSFAKGRGPRTDLQLLDECGFYQDLVPVESALLPSLQTTGGRALYLSTPAESVGHPYTARIYAAQAAGRYQHDTFWSNPRVDHEAVIEAERTRLGLTREALLASTYFRREYLAEIVTDESRAALPAWTREAAAELVGDWKRPAYFDGYSALDVGKGGDPHAALWGWYTPREGLVIEAECEARSASTTITQWADSLRAIERELYGEAAHLGTLAGADDWLRNVSDAPDWMRGIASQGVKGQPYLRVGDPSEKHVLMSLSVDHRLGVLPSRADDKHMAVDAVNDLLRTRRLRINARCVRLIEQLYSTVWNRTRSEWERTDRDHGDLLDCLVYLVRNVSWHHDAAPPPPRDPYLREPGAQQSGWKRLVA